MPSCSEFNTERPHEALAMKCPAEVYTPSPRPYDGLPELDLSVARPRCPRHRLRPHLPASQEDQHLHRARRSDASASRRSTTAFGSSASCTMISDTSTWSRKPCNPSTTRSARGCHPCLRYDPLPMSPGRTREAGGGESGIRTHGTVSRTHAFQACALSHSAISPDALVLKGQEDFCKRRRKRPRIFPQPVE